MGDHKQVQDALKNVDIDILNEERERRRAKVETTTEGPQIFALSDNEASASESEAEAPTKRAKREATPASPAGSEGEQSMQSLRDEVPPLGSTGVKLAENALDVGISDPEGGDSNQWKQVIPRGRKTRAGSPPLQRPRRSRSRGALLG